MSDPFLSFTEFKPNTHRLLRRQLRQVAEKDIEIETKWHSLLSLVNEAYLAADRDKRLLENALDTSADELTTANSKLQLFINNAPAGIAMFDNKMNYLFASKRWLDDRKINSYDVIGKNHYRIFPDMPEKWRQSHLRCLAGGTESCDEDLIVLSDGTEAWVRWEMLPWKNPKGQIGGIIILSENITKRKMAEAELHIASVAFQSRDPMLVTNAKGVILKANEDFHWLLDTH